jgi:hypothetical protein
MNRAIYSLLVLVTCAVQVACSSSGDTTGPVIRQIGVSQTPPPDPNLPSTGAYSPPSDPNLAPPDPNLPPPDPNAGGGTTRPSVGSFVPSQATCTALCTGLADTQCLGECISRCAAYVVLYTRCPTQVGAAAACVQSAGFVCDDQGSLHIAGGACEAVVAALDSCGNSANPTPTSTGITPLPTGTGLPNEPPPLPPFVDGGR